MTEPISTSRLIYRALGIPDVIPDERAAALAPHLLISQSPLSNGDQVDWRGNQEGLSTASAVIAAITAVIDSGDLDLHLCMAERTPERAIDSALDTHIARGVMMSLGKQRIQQLADTTVAQVRSVLAPKDVTIV